MQQRLPVHESNQRLISFLVGEARNSSAEAWRRGGGSGRNPQAAAGVDVVNDAEHRKPVSEEVDYGAWATYIWKRRFSQPRLPEW
jgi:hypothetical protein